MLSTSVVGALGLIMAGKTTSAAAATTAAPPLEVAVMALSFGAPFGDNMVLQMAPARAAVYGVLGTGGTGVAVTVERGGKTLFTVDAKLNATAQPFGEGFGPRPANTCVVTAVHTHGPKPRTLPSPPPPPPRTQCFT